MNTLMLSAALCLFQFTLIPAYSHLTYSRVESYFTLTEEIMNFPPEEDDEFCMNVTSILNKIAEYIREVYPPRVREILNSPEIDLASQWYETFSDFCWNVPIGLLEYGVLQDGFPECELPKLNITHFVGSRKDELKKLLTLIEDFMNRTTSFVSPVIQAGFNLIIKRSNVTSERIEECKLSLYRYKDNFLRRKQRLFKELLEEISQLRNELDNPALQETLQKELSLVFPLSKVIVLFNCEITGITEPGRNAEHFRNCIKGGPLFQDN